MGSLKDNIGTWNPIFSDPLFVGIRHSNFVCHIRSTVVEKTPSIPWFEVGAQRHRNIPANDEEHQV